MTRRHYNTLWQRFQHSTGWLLDGWSTLGLALLCFLIVMYGASAIRVYFYIVRELGLWIGGGS